MRPLSIDIRTNIINQLQKSFSTLEIADKAHVHHSTVARLRKTVLPLLKTSKGGRKPILNGRSRRLLVRKITSGEVDTAVQAQKIFEKDQGIIISAKAIRNALKKEGLKAAVKKKKPLLSSHHKKQRLDFAKRYQNWTVEDWKRVVWPDKSKINRLGSDGRKWCWKTPGSQLHTNQVTPTVKYGNGSIMIWGCMTAKGVGYMCRIDSIMNSEIYKDILNDYLFASVDYYRISRDNFIFQQDNDPKHTSKTAMNWLDHNNIELL